MLSAISESFALEITNCPIAKSPFIFNVCNSLAGTFVAIPAAAVSGVTGFDFYCLGK